MCKKRFGIGAVVTILALFLAGILFASKAAAAGKRVIVVFDPASTPRERRTIVLQYRCPIIRELSIVPAVVVSLPEVASDRAREAILTHAPVIRIEDDLIVEAFKKPGELPGKKPPKEEEPQPVESLPWGIDKIDAELVWANSTGLGVKVAILDTGTDVDHPDLMENIAGGINIINPRKHYDDDNGHGTHVAGIIAAVDQGEIGVGPGDGSDGAIGVIGVSSKTYLYGVKVLDRKGIGWLSDIIAGLEWCVNNEMDVVNMSLGTSGDSQTFYEVVIAVYEAGIIQVASAGNDGTAVSYPAAYPETIAVSATDSLDNVTSWSNYGPEIDLTAPGADINSTYKGGGYKILSGTSMAAPHVTGTCALVLENQPGYTPDEVKDILMATADDLGFSTILQGAGLVDAEEAALTSEP